MRRNLLILVLSLQTAWILGTSVVQERGFAVGQVVMLETQPVDPRDLLRGEYLILSYKISDVPLSAFTPARTNGPAPGTTVYVALERRGDFHQIARASTQPIAAGTGEVVIRGRAQSWWNDRNVHLEYGLERYYVREGNGNPRGKITVRAAVPASGRAQIKEVLLEGEPFEEAMKRANP